MYRWVHSPGRAPDGEDFDVSADLYHRFRDDIRLMRRLGLRAYTFETAWSRVLPDGTGRVNPRGLGFYDALVDALLDAGIAPLCNLYVFDHPVELEDRGGWLNRDMATWFGDYSAIVYERLGDRVEYWTTMCEPRFLSHVGHAVGAHLPGKSDISAGMRALHHLLLGQGHAVEAFRASGAAGRIGGQHLVIPVTAASDGERDLAAERTAAYFNAIQDRDLKTIVAPVDFLGVDYYLRLTVK